MKLKFSVVSILRWFLLVDRIDKTMLTDYASHEVKWVVVRCGGRGPCLTVEWRVVRTPLPSKSWRTAKTKLLPRIVTRCARSEPARVFEPRDTCQELTLAGERT